MSFLRNLFSRHTATTEAVAFSTSVQAAAPVRPLFPVPTPSPAPVDKQAEPVAPVQAAAVTGAGKSVECISLPLKVITDIFTPELKAALRKQPSEHVQADVPRGLIQPQLVTGAVRITFVQLRAAAPEIFFDADAAPAEAKVVLPLDQVLRQMMPARRGDQRQPVVPVNVPSIFVKTGQGRADGGRANGESWYSQRRPTYEAPAEPAPATEAPAPAGPPAMLRMPSAPAPAPPAAAPTPAPKSPAPPAAAKPLSLEKATHLPEPEAAARPRGTALPGTFALPLAAIAQGIAPEIHIALNRAPGASLIIPIEEIEAKMRTGKLVFKWWQLREWCSGELPAAFEAETPVELPLATVAPLFMASQKPREPRKQVQVDPRIPDVFAQTRRAPVPAAESPAAMIVPEANREIGDPGIQPAAESPATVIAAPLPPAPAPAAPCATAPPVQAPGRTGPAAVVNRICALAGVTGAFLATGDGLLVAGSVPDSREDLLAAFAPTMFAQLTKFSSMARLGVPESADIHFAGATVHVTRLGKLYLGVLMPAGRPLPAREIATISSELKPLAS